MGSDVRPMIGREAEFFQEICDLRDKLEQLAKHRDKWREWAEYLEDQEYMHKPFWNELFRPARERLEWEAPTPEAPAEDSNSSTCGDRGD